MAKLEFRTAPDGMIYYKEEEKEERRLTRFSTEIIESVARLIERNFPQCFARLATLYGGKGNSEEVKHKVRVQMVERFIRCNFGEHDLLTPDIEHDIMHFEEVKCPLRGGFCSHENVICKPKGLIQLSKAERSVVKLYVEGYTFKDIAAILEKSPATVKAQLYQVKKRLKLDNCREIIRVCRAQNY